jgi:glycosyltransferase involved in cell wall biosynthesis
LGIPAIVADTSAARDSVIDGETGLWFRGGDVEDLAQKLRTLEDDDLAATLGNAAYLRYWASPPQLTRHADELERCYESIMEASRPRVTSVSVQ